MGKKKTENSVPKTTYDPVSYVEKYMAEKRKRLESEESIHKVEVEKNSRGNSEKKGIPGLHEKEM